MRDHPPEKPHETEVYTLIKGLLVGIHLSPEHAAELIDRIQKQTIQPYEDTQ